MGIIWANFTIACVPMRLSSEAPPVPDPARRRYGVVVALGARLEVVNHNPEVIVTNLNDLYHGIHGGYLHDTDRRDHRRSGRGG